MLAIEDSLKLTLSNLSAESIYRSDQGQFEVMKGQVLRQIGYDPVSILLTDEKK